MNTLPLARSLSGAEVSDHAACLDAFQQELDYLCRTLRRLGVYPADVEDLLHEVFLVLMRKWAEYDPSRALRPYLFGVAFRVARAHQRRRARERPRAAVEEEDRALRPDQLLEAEQARRLVLLALERVPLARRAVLVMHDLDEVPMRDIASALSIPLFTGYSRLRKARLEFEAGVQSIRQERKEP